MKTSTKQFSLILHHWNPYLVKAEDMQTKPNVSDFRGYRTTDEEMEAFSKACSNWIASIEHYYVTPELQDALGWESGYGSKTRDVKNLFHMKDFEIELQDTIEHMKIAKGVKNRTLKNQYVAIPIKK